MNAPVSKFTQIRPVGAEFMREDLRTDEWMNGWTGGQARRS